jgi:hypothetical protein
MVGKTFAIDFIPNKISGHAQFFGGFADRKTFTVPFRNS